MAKLTRIRRNFSRVVSIRGRDRVVVIGKFGITFRDLGSRKRNAFPVTWEELLRDGGALDAVELDARPLLKLAFK